NHSYLLLSSHAVLITIPFLPLSRLSSVLQQFLHHLFHHPRLLSQKRCRSESPKFRHDKYDGGLGGCRSFLMQCDLVFDLQPYSYASDKARIAFVIELLRGKALEWASALWERQDSCLASYHAFSAEMRKLFEHPVRVRTHLNGCARCDKDHAA
uniref:DUF4939 domain-containing protein n=1 Tax=Sander lucioperca TaxID=283035 RepID=A0A8D0A597_SANLU